LRAGLREQCNHTSAKAKETKARRKALEKGAKKGEKVAKLKSKRGGIPPFPTRKKTKKRDAAFLCRGISEEGYSRGQKKKTKHQWKKKMNPGRLETLTKSQKV